MRRTTDSARLLAAAAVIAGVGCAAPIPRAAPASALDVRYRQQRQREARRLEVATAVYRGVLGKSLYSQCEMVPTDSQVFERRAKACGGLRSAVLGIARLLLERAATPAFLEPVRLDGRLRWVDLPPAESPCALSPPQ